jgi:serine/threonine protein kinase
MLIYDTDSRAVLYECAVKLPKFASLPGTGHKLDLTRPEAQSRLRDIHVEIQALCHPLLRNHLHIVDLVGWGLDLRRDGDEWRGTPFLALELAHDDLEGALRRGVLSAPARLQVLADVASALDAVHAVGLVHGDLKPSNVLLFRSDDGSEWLAKLGDFASGTALAGEEEQLLRGRGTVGWRAPELARLYSCGEPIEPSTVSMIDAYSFGLLIWSVLCGTYKPPKDGESPGAMSRAVNDLQNQSLAVPMLQHVRKAAVAAVQGLLAEVAAERPPRLAGLIGGVNPVM